MIWESMMMHDRWMIGLMTFLCVENFEIEDKIEMGGKLSWF